MCTIGNVFINNPQGTIAFKQCDLTQKTMFLNPVITEGMGDIRCLPFRREGHKGCWSGVNNYGVSFVAADSYLQPQTNTMVQKAGDIFDEYEKIISSYKTAWDAASHMCDFYKSFPDPDILLINDSREAYYIEANGDKVVCIKRTDRFFACTNHFRALTGAVDYKNNHSTYLRLERAEANLQQEPNITGVCNVVTDQYYGETVLSVCRVNQTQPPFQVPTEEPYFTQATSIFIANGKTVDCAFQLNGNPRNNCFTYIEDIFGTATMVNDVPVQKLALKIQKS
jgi:hypothetical protein